MQIPQIISLCELIMGGNSFPFQFLNFYLHSSCLISPLLSASLSFSFCFPFLAFPPHTKLSKRVRFLSSVYAFPHLAVKIKCVFQIVPVWGEISFKCKWLVLVMVYKVYKRMSCGLLILQGYDVCITWSGW